MLAWDVGSDICRQSRGRRYRQPELDGCTISTSRFDLHISTVIPHDFVHDRETQPGPGILAESHERFEHRLTHFLGNSLAIIRDGYFNMIVDSSGVDLNSGRICRNRFAGVLQDIVESPVEFLGIKPTLSRSFMIQCDLNLPELGP